MRADQGLELLTPRRVRVRWRSTAAAAALVTGISSGALAAAPPPPPPGSVSEVVVTGEKLRAKTDLSTSATAQPASVTVLSAEEISRTPVASYADLFRPVAGVDISNFGQGGIGYGVALRGFTDAEHGRDIGFVIDGVPINEVSSLQAPGYADLNVLLPETVDHIDIVRGPYDIEHGDNSVGGTINIVTKAAQPFSSLGVSGGSYENARGVGVFSRPAVSIGGLLVTPLIGLELVNEGGYRDNAYFRHFNSFNKFSFPAAGGVVALRAHFYGGEFGQPSYLNRDLIRAGKISERAAVGPTDGGYKYQQDVVGHYTRGAPTEALDLTGFVSHDTFLRATDFGGGQSTGAEERTTSGGTLRKVWSATVAGLPTQLLAGADVRADQVDARRFPSTAQRPRGPDRLNISYDEERVGGYVQFQVKPLSWAKITAGTRYDHLFYDVRDHIGTANTLTADSGVFSPKVGVSLTPISGVELYANYGEGFRSPSVVDELLTNPSLESLKLTSEEAGARYTLIPRVTLGLDAYITNISNEAFQPAPDLPVQNLGKSQRSGFDIESRWTVLSRGADTVSLFANLGVVRARLLGQGLAKYVPNVPRSVAQLGVDFNLGRDEVHRFDGSLRVDLIGRKNLSADAGQQAPAFQRVSGKLNYGFTPSWTGFAQFAWYPGDRLSEAAFNFGDSVGASSSDIFVSAQPEITFQVGVTRRFNTGG